MATSPNRKYNRFHSKPQMRRVRKKQGSNFGPNPSMEMSPELALVEFISSSAAVQRIHVTTISQLEKDIMEFGTNLMPANAAAWYLAKRKFYKPDSPLLAQVLKGYPDKFTVEGFVVRFLEEYDVPVAQKKLKQLNKAGLIAYFAHKMEEYEVYFFDPEYYENTEPFRSSFKNSTNPRMSLSKVVSAFFQANSDKFVYNKISDYLAAISKVGVPIKVNMTGVVTDILDPATGLITFSHESGTSKAIFSKKSVYCNGYQYFGDLMHLPHVRFDAYRVTGATPAEWQAVLVWTGRKVSPRYNATKEDLMPLKARKMANKEMNNNLFADFNKNANNGKPRSKSLGPSNESSNDMVQVGEVKEIKKDGAVVSRRRNPEDRTFIPGFRAKNSKNKKFYLSTLSGIHLHQGDLVAFYLNNDEVKEGYSAIGYNVMVLESAKASKSDEENDKKKKIKRNKKKSTSSDGGKDDEGSGGEGGKKRVQRKKRTKSTTSEGDKPERPQRSPRRTYGQFLLFADVETESAYNSDVDRSYGAAAYFDPDLDYDEYSDGEIPEDEQNGLQEDKQIDIEDLRKKLEAAEIEEREAKKAEKEAQAAAKKAAKTDKPAEENSEEKTDPKADEAPTAEPQKEKPAEVEAKDQDKAADANDKVGPAGDGSDAPLAQ